MFYQAKNRNLFQRVLLTVFSTLLFVGVAGLTRAQAENLTGTAKGIEYCNDGTGLAEKGKIKVPITLIVIQSPLPSMDITVNYRGETTSGQGIALAKNAKSGLFVIDTDDAAVPPIRYITLSGKYKKNRTGEIVFLGGNFIIQDRSGSNCITSGKFKVKTNTIILN